MQQLLMLDRHRTCFSRIVAAMLVPVFWFVCVTSSFCPVCLSQDVPSTQQPAAQNMNHHHERQDCDRDGCSCCGFQFLTMTHQTILKALDSTEALTPPATLAPTDSSSDFYRPPRS